MHTAVPLPHLALMVDVMMCKILFSSGYAIFNVHSTEVLPTEMRAFTLGVVHLIAG